MKFLDMLPPCWRILLSLEFLHKAEYINNAWICTFNLKIAKIQCMLKKYESETDFSLHFYFRFLISWQNYCDRAQKSFDSNLSVDLLLTDKVNSNWYCLTIVCCPVHVYLSKLYKTLLLLILEITSKKVRKTSFFNLWNFGLTLSLPPWICC